MVTFRSNNNGRRSGFRRGKAKEVPEAIRKATDRAKRGINNIADRFDEVLCLNRHCCAYGDPLKVFTQDVLSELYGSHGTMFQNHKLGSHGEN